MKIILIALFCIVSFAAFATVYKVVNKDGTITYTDTPQEGAEPINLGSVNSASMPSLTNSQSQPVKPVKKVERVFPDYQLTLVSPSVEETIRDNLGRVTVAAKLEPTGSGTFELYMDGELLKTSPNPTFKLEGVVRGEHSVVVKFVHNTGKILASTPPRIFFLKQNSILINPNPGLN